MTQDELKKKQFQCADVSAVLINYNGGERLKTLLAAIMAMHPPAGEVLIVDDGSTDNSAQNAASQFADVKLIVRETNSGGVLNKMRNLAIANASKELVLIIDNDVEVYPNTLAELVKAFNQLPKAAACITRAVHFDQPEIIYQDGQILHFVGASPGTNRDANIADVDDKPRVSIGWGVQMFSKTIAKEVDNFDEGFILGWGDDGEFNHKLNLIGYNCYQVSQSVVKHHRSESSKRFYGAIRNRWRFILIMYQWRTIFLCIPAFLIYEVAQFGFTLLKGQPGAYFKGTIDGLKQYKSLKPIREKIQKKRVLSDSQVMGSGDIFVYSDYLDNKILSTGFKCLNFILNGYWHVIKRFV